MFTVHVSRRDQNADKIWPLQFRKNPLSPLHVQYFVLALNCVVCLAKVIPFINNFKLSIWKEITVRWEAFANIYPLENNSLAVVEHNLIWKVSLLPEWFNQLTVSSLQKVMLLCTLYFNQPCSIVPRVSLLPHPLCSLEWENKKPRRSLIFPLYNIHPPTKRRGRVQQ